MLESAESGCSAKATCPIRLPIQSVDRPVQWLQWRLNSELSTAWKDRRLRQNVLSATLHSPKDLHLKRKRPLKDLNDRAVHHAGRQPRERI